MAALLAKLPFAIGWEVTGYGSPFRIYDLLVFRAVEDAAAEVGTSSPR
jgi:hypothetical protein